MRGLGWRIAAFVQRLKDGRRRSGAGRAGRRRQRQGHRRPPRPSAAVGGGAERLRRAEGAGPRGRTDSPPHQSAAVAEGGVLRRRSKLQWAGSRGGVLRRLRPARHAAAPFASLKALPPPRSGAVAGGRQADDGRGPARPLPRGSRLHAAQCGGRGGGRFVLGRRLRSRSARQSTPKSEVRPAGRER